MDYLTEYRRLVGEDKGEFGIRISNVAWGHDFNIVHDLVAKQVAPGKVTHAEFKQASQMGVPKPNQPGRADFEVAGYEGTKEDLKAALNKVLTKRTIEVW